jgi:membrane protein DedA with SNARE-associated domain
MFWLGKLFGEKIIETNKFKFLSEENLRKPENWFKKYGYWLIVANRFLAGTRAVISFFAGISHLRFGITMILSVVSSLLWNAFILYLGAKFGQHWEVANDFIGEYGKFLMIGIIAAFVVWIVIRIVKRSMQKAE